MNKAPIRPSRVFTGAPRRRAYTLAEVLVTVSIMGIAAAMIVPQMLKTGTLQIQAAGRMVIADILYAQNDAIALGTNRNVVFNQAGNSYMIADCNGNPLPATWRMGAGSQDNGNYSINFSTDPKFSGCQLGAVSFAGSNTLSFDNLGTPSSGGTVNITMANTTYRVSVAPFTGRVTIAPYP